jgi:hypothetical protein
LIDLWAVKFYPFTESGADPIFAAVGNNNVRSMKPLNPNLSADKRYLDIHLQTTSTGREQNYGDYTFCC